MEVEGGLEQATDAAEQAGLDLLGEVLPESGLWHMRQPRRCKRSPGEVQASKHTQMLSVILHIFEFISSVLTFDLPQVHSSIASVPSVVQVQPQKVLSRVKRQGGGFY